MMPENATITKHSLPEALKKEEMKDEEQSVINQTPRMKKYKWRYLGSTTITK